MCVQKSSGGVVFWCKILEKIFRQKKCVFFLECPSTDDRRPTKYARMVARQRRRRRAWNDGARKTPKSPPPRVVATRPRQQRQQRQQRAIAMRLCGRYFFGVHKTNVSLLRRFALCFSSRFLSALLTYVFALVMRRGRYLLVSQNCFSSLFRSLLFESFSLRFVDVRLYARLFFLSPSRCEHLLSVVFDAFGLSPPPFLRFRRLGLLPSGGVFVVVVVVVVVLFWLSRAAGCRRGGGVAPSCCCLEHVF